ncbi:TetR/AcrR family transcriptional regulator [Embleya sp. MST-111070]|uniref:TetR/AcrR family transcriptional regulator n=1 Tax=Embleya sp. MST-111070 TaxID=3398231 RepID=UPI003F731863
MPSRLCSARRAAGVPVKTSPSVSATRRRHPSRRRSIQCSVTSVAAPSASGAKGYEGLTIEGVAERSGVNKTTIYRWWPSKGALLGAALTGARRLEFAMPDTGSLRGDLEALMDGMVSLLTTPPTADIAVAALGAVTHSAELAEHAGTFFAGRG